MYSNKVEICGVNTAKLPVLKEEEKMRLLKRARNGDKQAREELISGNLRLVLSVVQKFSNRGENLDDLFQVGCIGLMKAIDNFNPDLDVRFSTYGVPMIVGEIRRFLRDNNAIRVSRSMRDTAYRAMQAKEQFIHEKGREPTIVEIAQRLCCKKEDVVLALESVVDPVSLYEPATTATGWRRSACGTPSARWGSGRKRSSPCAFFPVKPKPKLPARSASPRRRSPAWKRVHSRK